MVAAIPFRPVVAQPDEAADRVHYLARWLRVWLAVLVVTTLVVVAYLVLIGLATHGIAVNLGSALQRVKAVRADVNALPNQVETVNTSLRQIASSVTPLPNDLATTNSSLGRVNDDLSSTTVRLSSIDSALGTTTAMLQTTTGRLGSISGSLKDTSGSLTSIDATASRIVSALRAIHAAPGGLGAAGIASRVATINGVLDGAHTDTGNILDALRATDGQLTSICRSPLLYVLGAAPPC